MTKTSLPAPPNKVDSVTLDAHNIYCHDYDVGMYIYNHLLMVMVHLAVSALES